MLFFPLILGTMMVEMTYTAIPTFTAPGTPGRVIPVSETTTVGKSVYQVVAIDADGDKLTYALTSQEPASPTKFSISSPTGLISTIAPFDYDLPGAVTSYVLTIRVTDGANNAQTTLTIRIMDDNDNAPVFRHQVILRENAPIGTIVTAMQASDLDSGSNGLIKYDIIAGDVNSHFGIDANSGILFTKYTLDFDDRDIYELVIRATDHGTTPRATTVTMTVSLLEALGNGTCSKSWLRNLALALILSFLRLVVSY